MSSAAPSPTATQMAFHRSRHPGSLLPWGLGEERTGPWYCTQCQTTPHKWPLLSLSAQLQTRFTVGKPSSREAVKPSLGCQPRELQGYSQAWMEALVSPCSAWGQGGERTGSRSAWVDKPVGGAADTGQGTQGELRPGLSPVSCVPPPRTEGPCACSQSQPTWSSCLV